MSKDPAILWYWDSWTGGTLTLSRAQKGAYMDLLAAQHSCGHLSLDEIKTVLGSDFGSMWPTLQKKFVKDDNGLFYNVKAKEVKEKRKAFTDSRKKNLSTKESPHMDLHVINKDININHPFKSEEWLKTWERWINHRKSIKKPYKSIDSEQEQLDWFVEKKYTQEQAIETIKNSIRSGYQGIFELDEKSATTKAHGPGFPNYYSPQFEKTLPMSQVSAWWQHLRKLGWEPRKDRFGNIVEWIKPQVA